MFVGSLMSIIWTPSSFSLATIAYVLEPIVNTATSVAPLSSVNVSPFESGSPSVAEAVVSML